MKVFYIDVYFLINFTVDILALYFAGLFSGIKTTLPRLIISSFIGGAVACVFAVFNLSGIVRVLFSLFYILVITLIFVKVGAVIRKMKFICAFMLLEMLFAGAVVFFYEFLERNLGPFLNSEVGIENRKALIIALLIALTYFVLKIVFTLFFASGRETCVELLININEETISVNALVDSGNLLVDPMSASPVIIVKEKAVPLKISEVESNSLLKTRIRLIPAKGIGGSKILMGLRCDSISVNGTVCNINTIAIDEEEGSYGGYYALAPASVINL